MALPVYPKLPGLVFPFVREPVWSTIKQTSWSGKTTRLQTWTFPLRRRTLSYQFLRTQQTELQTLEGFYNSVGGPAQPFSFTDIDDQSASLAAFGVGDGITRTFQLLRPWGGFSEPVYLPRSGFQVFINGTATTAYAIGANPGQIIFTGAPANGSALTWTGGYDWLCQFDDDEGFAFEKFISDSAGGQGYWRAAKSSFTTVKL